MWHICKSLCRIVFRCRFNQHFTHAFYANIFVPKKLQSQNVTREMLRKALLYEKFLLKMLMKLTIGIFQQDICPWSASSPKSWKWSWIVNLDSSFLFLPSQKPISSNDWLHTGVKDTINQKCRNPNSNLKENYSPTHILASNEFWLILRQGSQTQSDSRATWDSKKGLEGLI